MSQRTRSRDPRLSSAARIAVLACAAALSLAACSSGGASDGATGGESAAGSGEVAPDRAAADGGQNAKSISNLQARALDQRAIVRHGSLELKSTHVQETRDAVVAATKEIGGYVASEHSTTGDDGTTGRTDLQLVVPTDKFDTAMGAVANEGTVVSRRQSAKDVTDEVVDVDARVASARSSLDRVRTLLDRADTLGEVIRLESELSERQSDLESLEARQQSLASRTNTATIDLTVRAIADEPTGESDDEAGFIAGLSAGWEALLTVGSGLLTALGAVLPFAVAIAIPAVPIVALVRRAVRRRTATAG